MSQLSKKPSKQPLNQTLNQPNALPQSSSKPSISQFIKYEWRLLLVAVHFLTRLPVPQFAIYNPQWLHQSSRHLPGVGMLDGYISTCVLVPDSRTCTS